MHFDFGSLNWEKFGALTQKKFLAFMKRKGQAHILAGDPERTRKLKDAHALMKLKYKVHTVTPGKTG